MLMNIINILFIFVVIIVMAYIFGMVLINIIDNRLNKISFNVEKFSNKDESSVKVNNIDLVIKNKESVVVAEEKKMDFTFDEEYYQQMEKDKKINGFDEKVEFKPWNIEKKVIPACFKNHEHIKDGSSLDCTYGVTNYADPYDMSPMDNNLFILNYPRNMTLQDYINWLYCFKGKEDQLPYNHLKNLEKMKNGKKLVYEEGVLPPPGYNYPALTSEDYFDKMYNGGNELNIAAPLNSPTNAMMGYNYNEYSEFSQNADVYGSTGTLRNPDIGNKKNSRKFHDFIDAKDSNNIEMTKEYDIYRIKKNEV